METIRISYWLIGLLRLSSMTGVEAVEYDIGPGQAYMQPGDFAWESLAAGDIVRIHFRAEPYKDNWVLCRQDAAGQDVPAELKRNG